MKNTKIIVRSFNTIGGDREGDCTMWVDFKGFETMQAARFFAETVPGTRAVAIELK